MADKEKANNRDFTEAYKAARKGGFDPTHATSQFLGLNSKSTIAGHKAGENDRVKYGNNNRDNERSLENKSSPRPSSSRKHQEYKQDENSDRRSATGRGDSTLAFVVCAIYLFFAALKALQLDKNNGVGVGGLAEVGLIIFLLPGLLFWFICKVLFVIIVATFCTVFSSSGCVAFMNYLLD